MALSVLHAAGLVAQVPVKINRLNLRHVVPVVQNHAAQKRSNAYVSIVIGIISDK
jgi:hypothetical protein